MPSRGHAIIMFYITHGEEAEEAEFLRAVFAIEPQPADLPPVTDACALRLEGQETQAVGTDAALWLDPQRACWCVLEAEERWIADHLRRGLSYGELADQVGRERDQGLKRLLGHWWRLGLLVVDDQSRWPADMYARGPLFRASYLIEIHLTSRCNLACRYCFANAEASGTDLSADLARRAVDLALELPGDDLTIEFSGGEPLLRLPLLEELIVRIEERSSERDAPVQIALQTNGLLLDPAACALLDAHPQVSVGISLDGPARLNDVARVGPDGQSRHAQVEAAARQAVLRWDRQAGALAVVHSASWSEPRQVAAYLASLGLGKIRFNPMALLGRGSAQQQALGISADQYLSFMAGILDYLAETRAFEESTLEALVHNLVVRTRAYRCMRSPCGAGYDYLVVTAAGDIYPCARFLERPDLCMGNVSDGHSLEGRYAHSESVCRMADRVVGGIAECQSCLWRHFCEGGCALAAASNQGKLDAPDPLCEFYRGAYPLVIEHLYRHPQMVPHYFPEATAHRVGPASVEDADLHSAPAP